MSWLSDTQRDICPLPFFSSSRDATNVYVAALPFSSIFISRSPTGSITPMSIARVPGGRNEPLGESAGPSVAFCSRPRAICYAAQWNVGKLRQTVDAPEIAAGLLVIGPLGAE